MMRSKVPDRPCIHPFGARALGWLALAAVATPESAAQAQAGSLGFRVGEKSKIHTNLDVSTLYDTNTLRAPDADRDRAEDVRILIRPSLELDVPGKSVAFKFGLGATISQFLGTSTLPSDTAFGFDGNVYLRLGSNKSAVAFVLDNSPMLTPTVIPTAGTIQADERLFPAFVDAGRAYLTLRPGGGALEFDVGYRNEFTIFTRERVEGTSPAPDDAFTHAVFIESRLKFLPKTAAVFYGEFGWFDPSNPRDLAPDDPNRDTLTLNANPFNLQVGLLGQITRSISAEIRAGYGETLVWREGHFSAASATNQRTVIGLASVTWQPIRTAKLSLTYQRAAQPVVALSSMISDAVRLRGDWSIDRLVLGAYAEVQFRDFGLQEGGPRPNADFEREPAATLFFAGARADYYFLDWLTGGLAYQVLLQSSNDEDRGAAALPLLGGFTRHQIFANVGIRY